MGPTNVSAFGGVYQGRRVLVTGHTGFKGSWLTSWLLELGAEVIGFSRDVPTDPSMFEGLGLGERVADLRGDVRDAAALRTAVRDYSPHFVFHLAAQSLVSQSYADPLETLGTNVMGTAHVLDALRGLTQSCTAVLITSDKCYDNVEWIWGYRESDRLGGKDVYSGSKGAAELAIRSYVESFFEASHPVRIGVGRAGNVVGGGDWAKDRIVADCVRAWSQERAVEVRSPRATRPWQHVLEPLSGYLTLGAALSDGHDLHGEAFNFGPRAEQNHTVATLIEDLGRRWGHTDITQSVNVTEERPFHEAGLLKLNCDKALARLEWEPTLSYEEMIELVAAWYQAFYRGGDEMYSLTSGQIGRYRALAAERGRRWATKP